MPYSDQRREQQHDGEHDIVDNTEAFVDSHSVNSITVVGNDGLNNFDQSRRFSLPLEI